MSAPSFTSAFAEQLHDYLAFKTKMGAYGNSRIWYLTRFDAYCAENDRTVFDRETVEGWVTAQLASSDSRYRSWMSYIRDLGRWLAAHRDSHAYVLSNRWKAATVPAHPYLLTTDEIERFFAAAANVQAQSPWRWQAVAFFTLMHSCGLRTGETRLLGTDGVDLRAGHIEVLRSKGNRSRRLPLTSAIVDILGACDRATRTQFGPSRASFFVSSTARQVTPAAVGVMFHRIWDQAGLPRPVNGQQPRPYDFRHHFAYANIEQWMRQGTDVTAMLPYLARYMGHASVDSTYYYIHTSPDFMGDYAHITAKSGSLLPEVGFA